jgi:hypothetical protein
MQPTLAPVIAGLGKIFIAEVTELGLHSIPLSYLKWADDYW